MDEHLNLRLNDVIKSQAADYKCLQRLGVGGTAETYLMLGCAGRLRGQLFAVKVFRRLSKPQWRQGFLNEISFLQGCEHPAIMRVFDEGLYLDEYPFVVAEYLPRTVGGVFRTALMMEKLAYAVQLISALEYLSSPEIAVIHRDIKPANVFIKGGSCVLGDFGLMKRLSADRDLDREMLLAASVGPRMPRNYRTPDLVAYYKGGPVPTEKSDVYQLGLLFAEMFSGTNPQRPMSQGDYAEPIELTDYFIPGGLGRPIKELIKPMLHTEPADRPSAAELVEPWQGLFLEAAKRSHALDGRVL